MDSRNIKEEPRIVEDGRYLESIYEYQKELLDHYIKIEGLPPYPVNINTKNNQTLLKDFSARVIEELMEAYEAMKFVEESIKKNNHYARLNDIVNGFVNGLDEVEDMVNQQKEDFKLMLSHLQNVGEEMADALHFMTELLIYSNIQPEDIRAYLKNRGNAYGDGEDIIETCYMSPSIAQSPWIRDDSLWSLNILERNLVYSELFGWEPSDTRYIMVGAVYSESDYFKVSNFMFEVIYHLNIARNFLKNKPWKQSQMLTDEEAFQEELVKAFIVLCELFYFMGADSNMVHWLYFKKNRVNLFRIKSKY